jgi:hypothetical protein
MAFTQAEIDNIANAALDFYIKGQPLSQQLQDKPLLAAMKSAQKTFGGGRGEIKGNVKANYTTSFMGYSDSDVVTYVNPANIKQYTYPWKELHAGIEVTLTELKKAGISVVDSTTGEQTTNHSQQELFEISNLLEDKLEDMDEGTARSLNTIYWQDGTASAKVFPGVQAIVADDPTVGVVGGIDRATNTWWRNRSAVGANMITADKSNQTLTKFLRSEYRQLRRYGGKPTLWLAGSAFIEALEAEVAEKGIYTQSGFVNKGQTNIGMAAINMNGVGDCLYDPTLDDLGRSDFSYMLDPRHLFPYVMEGEDMKTHNPARPATQYVLYRGVTWTGALTARKMNAHGVYQAAPPVVSP